VTYEYLHVVARRFQRAIRDAFPGCEDPVIDTLNLDNAPWVSAKIEDALVDTANDALIDTARTA
jgi:hypothetical protein